VLVALTILAVMALLSWRGIDGMARADEATQRHTDAVLALQASLAQWRADLDAMMTWPVAVADEAPSPDAEAETTQSRRSLAWDGRTLRITRTVAGNAAVGVRVVAWTRRTTDGQWLRWQSAPVRSINAWQAAWNAAARWAEAGATTDTGTAVAQAVALVGAQDWQLQYFRQNAWTNPLSSAAQSAADTEALPDAVRLLLTLAPGQPLSGLVQLDWVRPDFVGDAP
jgi:general secretion pathway protein J